MARISSTTRSVALVIGGIFVGLALAGVFAWIGIGWQSLGGPVCQPGEGCN